MEFQKYQHVERFGTDEVQGIEFGTCFVFPKIDGTNCSIWYNEGIHCASRNRELTDEDHFGFKEWVLKQDNIKRFLEEYPGIRLYGEWLVPHTLKTYRKDAWNKFYVFDIVIEDDENYEYVNYESYTEWLNRFDINFIPCIRILKNGTYEQFVKLLDVNDYLIEDGKGVGEGLVIKNYDYKNKYGRITWAKIVRSEFRENFHKTQGAPEQNGKKMIEEEIANEYCTEAIVDKAYQIIIKAEGKWTSKMIPRLLSTVYHDIITEETWNILKKHKRPTINFSTLNFFIINRIKELKKELF